MIYKTALDIAKENNHTDIVRLLSKGQTKRAPTTSKERTKSIKNHDSNDNEALLNEITNLRKEKNQLSKELKAQKEENSLLENENIQLKKELKKQKERNILLEKENKELKKPNERNSFLESENERLNRELIEQKAKNGFIKKENDRLKNEIKTLENENQHQDESKEVEYLRSLLFALKEKMKSIEYFSNNEYKEESIIGGGPTSNVKVVVKRERMKFAKKELKDFTYKTLQRFIAEVEILLILRHPCIVRIYSFSSGDKTHAPSMILKLEPTSLEKAIQNKELTNDLKNRLTVEVVLGMRYIHEHKFMHRDLKPSNILLSKNKHARISDFGLAKSESFDDSQTKEVGTLRFMAPELFEDNDIIYTKKVDVYSFGITLIYIVTENYPDFSLGKVSRGIIPSLPDTVVSWVQKLIVRCLSLSPYERPSFAEIFEIMKKNNYDLFSDRKKGKLTGKKLNMKRFIEKRILKIEAFEYQHQDE